MSKNEKIANLSPVDFLYGQSTLRRFNIKFEILGKIAPLILETEPLKEGNGQIITPVSGCKFYLEQIQDICEKLDFLRVCLHTVKHLEKHIDDGVFVFHVEETKFFFYTFIYNLKALMDSISMLLKEIFNLVSFNKGKIDIIRNQKFREALSQWSPTISQFFEENVKWTSKLLKFRDRLIHINRIPIFVKDKKSEAVFWIQFVATAKEGKHFYALDMTTKKVPELSFNREKIGSRKPFSYVFYKHPITLQEILGEKPRSHLPSDFESVSDFCENSFNLSTTLIEMVFAELYSKLSTD
jgi:uncharacterized protein YozE (UPF0346 family)